MTVVTTVVTSIVLVVALPVTPVSGRCLLAIRLIIVLIVAPISLSVTITLNSFR